MLEMQHIKITNSQSSISKRISGCHILINKLWT